jgi:hypothetical protein
MCLREIGLVCVCVCVCGLDSSVSGNRPMAGSFDTVMDCSLGFHK